MSASLDSSIPIDSPRADAQPPRPQSRTLLGRDWVALAAFCLLLFGFEMFSGRPLSLHEARLPQTAREMLAHHNWLFPQSGGRPWLERPPVPHWILIGASLLFGQRCDAVWIVRLPSVLMGLSIVLMTAWMASLWFGRNAGLMSGFVLATIYEFYAYAILAEDDIFLAAAVVLAVLLFVKTEFSPVRAVDPRIRFFGNRPWPVWAFFFMLGLTNVVKSPLVGVVVVVAPVGVFLLASGDWLRVRRYVWFWGWLLFAVLLFSWTLLAWHRYPDVLENWKFDYKETKEFDGPWWYYPVVMLGLCMPWIWAALVGFILTRQDALKQRASGSRFLWCWAILPVIVMSIPHRKHHHYMVPSIAPWAILAALGLMAIGRELMNPRRKAANPLAVVAIVTLVAAAGLALLHHKIHVRMLPLIGLTGALIICVGFFSWGMARRSGKMAAGACFIGIAIAYCWGQLYTPDRVAEDTAFLRRVDHEVPRADALYVNSDLGGEMDFFRNQFYLRSSAMLLHNLTYLRDQSITDKDVWVVTPQRDLAKLQTMGTVELADESVHSRSQKTPADRFALFHLHFRPDLQRFPRPAYVDTLQAMGRRKGPWCGPPFANDVNDRRRN